MDISKSTYLFANIPSLMKKKKLTPNCFKTNLTNFLSDYIHQKLVFTGMGKVDYIHWSIHHGSTIQ